MKILAIRFARLGDVILLLPALFAIKRSLPESRLTLLTGHRCAPIAEMCPAIDEVVAVDRLAMRDGPKWAAARDVLRLVRQLRAARFDAVADFHGFRETNLLAWLSGAGIRLGMQRSPGSFLAFCFNRPPVREDKALHVAEMFQRVAAALPAVRQLAVEGVTLRIPAAVTAWVEAARLPRPLLALYVDAPVADRRWAPESFAAVADSAAEWFGAYAVVLASPANAGAAARARQASRRPERLRVMADLSLPQLAGVIQASSLLISNDTGPMHLGPALAVPTLGLFSVGFPQHFRPMGTTNRFVRNESIEGISVDQVTREMALLWPTADPDLPR